MVRPKKLPGESRERLMQVRCQPGEYDDFKRAAGAAGLDLSGWVRERLRAAARRELRRQSALSGSGERGS